MTSQQEGLGDFSLGKLISKGRGDIWLICEICHNNFRGLLDRHKLHISWKISQRGCDQNCITSLLDMNELTRIMGLRKPQNMKDKMTRKQINSRNIKYSPKTIINAYTKWGEESIHLGRKKGKRSRKGHLEKETELLETLKEIKAVLIHFLKTLIENLEDKVYLSNSKTKQNKKAKEMESRGKEVRKLY